MDIHKQVISAFQVEHKEQVDGIRAVLTSLLQHGAASNDPRWNDAFRMAHTLKGGARVCDLRGIEALGHQMESLFSCVRDGSVGFDSNLARTIYRVLDDIEDFMSELATGAPTRSVGETLAALEELLESKGLAPLAGEPAPLRPVEPAAPISANTPLPSQEIETLRVPTHSLDSLLRCADSLFEMNADQDRAAREVDQLSGHLDDLQRQCDGASSKTASTLRRLAAIPEFAEIARHVESVGQLARRIARQHRIARRAQQSVSWTIRTLTDDLRRTVQHTRMVSADSILQSLGPMVRALARDDGKEVDFQAAGLHVQADRMVLQSLKDPVLHALRNAVVHGIERPDEREAAGKSRAGKISITTRTRGNRLHVLVEDDGRGLNLDVIAQTAAQQGIAVSAGTESETNQDALRRLLFRPGFSTSSSVTELAGRGMGLSVVQETISQLRGSVRIGPGAQSGTVLEMMLPLMISAERLLLISSSDQLFAVPSHSIEQLVRLPAKDVQCVDDRWFAIFEGAVHPLVSLAGRLSGDEIKAKPGNLSIVVIEAEGRRTGLVVDAFVAEREALIKPLDGPAARVKWFCGAMLLDDRNVALVLDPIALATGEFPIQVVPGPAQPKRSPIVLVVDDSFTTRTLEKGILETSGYEVRVAVDGIDALKLLRSEPIDLVIADVQMPRMDGLTLVKEIRTDARLESLPVILVTSLDRKQDYQRGMEVGANAYVVKQKFDHEELLKTIKRYA
ncbi:MAG: hybrid sensor histidine kinase/response regulator [Phycisphaerales bacterium]